MMKVCIYWFSGTGNSFWAAKTLARALNAALIPMAENMHALKSNTNSPIVLVFPVYNHLIPYLVQRFIANAGSLSHRKLYAVCTYGDSPGISLEYLQKRTKVIDGDLSGGYGLKMPYNYVSPGKTLRSVFQPFRLRELSEDTITELTVRAEKRLSEIAADISAGKTGTIETEYRGIEHLSDFLHLRNTLQKRFWLRKAGYRGKAQMTSVEGVQLMDTGFFTTEDCTGCGTCARVCPIENIHIQDGTPIWQHRCEHCFACLQWCPAQAIQFGQGTQGGKRYHHPQVQLQDIILNNKEKKG